MKVKWKSIVIDGSRLIGWLSDKVKCFKYTHLNVSIQPLLLHHIERILFKKKQNFLDVIIRLPWRGGTGLTVRHHVCASSKGPEILQLHWL